MTTSLWLDSPINSLAVSPVLTKPSVYLSHYIHVVSASCLALNKMWQCCIHVFSLKLTTLLSSLSLIRKNYIP